MSYEPRALKSGAVANLPSKNMVLLVALNARHMRINRTSRQPAGVTSESRGERERDRGRRWMKRRGGGEKRGR